MDGWVGGLGCGNRECSKVKKTRCIIPTPVTAMVWYLVRTTMIHNLIRTRFGSTDCPISSFQGFSDAPRLRSLLVVMVALHMTAAASSTPWNSSQSRAPRLAGIPGSSPPYVCASQAQGSCTAGRWIDYVSEWPGGGSPKNANHCHGVTDTELHRADSEFCDLRHAASATEGTVPRWPRSTQAPTHVEDYGFQKLHLPPPLWRTCEVEAEQARAYLIAADESSAGLGRAGNGSVQLQPGCKATEPV
ncbi:uncharacterized protein BO87DRAFT_410918 [Aspergillus neoniger CBS 115656]|uniref:Uncharacterized protein n=1 Tax=Aspergillus neoniger (strain CBS 115656) TaxID=1448310 RepID=A0A318Y8B2_ASPNB|nr:hypothetical protein BO87DRAFT_410918 [Aspergillus neoniger CBS 115656]PYH28910.1 hypothetical protein BO87DRAFT_410918 [Aspergillus neoniger CBS 115656]